MERDCESELSKLNIEQNACIYHFGASVIHGQRSNILRLQCKASLCRALFNKSAAQGFWSLFDKIYSLIIEKPEETIDYIYNKIDDEIIEQCPDFDALSIKYFIAKTKEGIQK